MLSYFKLRFFTNYDEVEKFSLDGLKTMAYVKKVYDGDTVTLIFKYKGDTVMKSCRLLGIDTPELRSKNPDEVVMAKKIRDVLSDKILNKIKYVEFHDFDKYGRPLITLYHKFSRKQSINDFMLTQECVQPYDGGKKKVFGS